MTSLPPGDCCIRGVTHEGTPTGIIEKNKNNNFAAQGFLTVVPDRFRGAPLNPEVDFKGEVDLPKWLTGHTTADVDPVADIVVNYLKNTLNVKKLAGVGYCFVGNVAGRRDIGYIAHPSFVTTEERSAITKPLTIAAAEIDPIFTAKTRFESEKILANLKIPYQINPYAAVTHGFALKGDLSINEVKFATDRAFEQAVSFFKFWL